MFNPQPYTLKNRKYSWLDKDMDDWLKQQAEELRKVGFKADTAAASQILLERVIKPNNINISQLIKPQIILKGKGKWKKQII